MIIRWLVGFLGALVAQEVRRDRVTGIAFARAADSRGCGYDGQRWKALNTKDNLEVIESAPEIGDASSRDRPESSWGAWCIECLFATRG